jgi:A/G-specific adenine glycosylase
MLNPFREALRQWFHVQQRPMPWRSLRTPYAVLVSEFMLHQTRVETVIPCFQRFLLRFPDLASLAAATEEQLLLAWQGLGYYRRARNLQAAARALLTRHGGEMPANLAELRKLPGVGPYTAAALASLACGLQEACLDGNVVRVLCRLLAVDELASRPATLRQLRGWARILLDEQNPGTHNEAMMELGASVCLARNPQCPICPVRGFCRTVQQGENPHLRPAKMVGKPAHIRQFHVFCGFREDSCLLALRPVRGLLAGQWEFPQLEAGEGEPLPGLSGEPAFVLRHRFTHIDGRYLVQLGGPSPPDELLELLHRQYPHLTWRTFSSLAGIPLTTLTRKILRLTLHRQPAGAACNIPSGGIPGGAPYGEPFGEPIGEPSPEPSKPL